MILDSELIISGTKSAGAWTGQSVAASGTTDGTGYVDTLAAGSAIKPGARVKVVSTEICAGTGTTLTINLVTGASSSFGTTLASTGAIAKASTVAGTVLMDMVIPVGVLRYLGIQYVTDNTFQTTGAVFASIVLDSDRTLDRSL